MVGDALWSVRLSFPAIRLIDARTMVAQLLNPIALGGAGLPVERARLTQQLPPWFRRKLTRKLGRGFSRFTARWFARKIARDITRRLRRAGGRRLAL